MAVSTCVSARSRFSRRHSSILLLSGLAVVTGLLSACAGGDTATTTPAEAAAAQPVTVENCGVEVTVAAPPQRAVTMNQAATEVMLALGLGERMVGTAYLDDEVLPEFADAYDSVAVLAEREYPSSETVLDTEPDLIYAAYPSAFEADAAGPRDELARLGISTYLSPSACPNRPADEPLSIEAVWQEIRDVGALFDAGDVAERLVADQRKQLDEALAAAGDLSAMTVMWWDGGDDVPSVGACCGGPGMIMTAAGVQNAFGDVPRSWSDVNWEQVAERNPAVIVLVDAEWSTAEEKRATITSTPAVSTLPAVRDERFVEIPFSATTPGVRNVSAIVELIDGLEKARGR